MEVTLNTNSGEEGIGVDLSLSSLMCMGLSGGDEGANGGGGSDGDERNDDNSGGNDGNKSSINGVSNNKNESSSPPPTTAQPSQQTQPSQPTKTTMPPAPPTPPQPAIPAQQSQPRSIPVVSTMSSFSSRSRNSKKSNKATKSNKSNSSKCDSPFDEEMADDEVAFSKDLFEPSPSKSSQPVTPSKPTNDQNSPNDAKLSKSKSRENKENEESVKRTSIELASSSKIGKEISNDSSNLSSNTTPNSIDQNINGSSTFTPPSSSDTLDPSEPAYYTSKPPSSCCSILTKIFTTPLTWSMQLREFRHSPCLMTPLSLVILFFIVLSSFVTLLLSFPQLVVGMILGPFVKRGFWLVEFLYRWDVARWGHVSIMKWGGKSKTSGTDKGGKEGKSDAKAAPETTNKFAIHAAQKRLEQLGMAGHSDVIHQRITVVEGRVYIHPIPQFMDNLAYLIVCCPPKRGGTSPRGSDRHGAGGGGGSGLPILGVLVDCGESDKIMAYLDCIYAQFYARDYPMSTSNGGTDTSGVGIELHAILCTHRHHDHTAGIKDLVAQLKKLRGEGGAPSLVISGGGSAGNGSKREENVYQNAPANLLIVGGAAEQVPHCNLFVKNGCFVPLPCASLTTTGSIENSVNDMIVNDMNALISIEVIGVPSHTRGSAVYALRNRVAPGIPSMELSAAALQSHLFTGDAIFSGGGGVPFEADLEKANDNFIKNPKKLNGKHGGSKFRPGAGTLSIERCFAEVLGRALGPWRGNTTMQSPQSTQSTQTLVYPGHEYTTDLLLRQLDLKATPVEGFWSRLPPSSFFTIASHYLVSAHRRALPQGNKLLAVPVSLGREVVCNPNFRSLKRRGEGLCNLLRLWFDKSGVDKIKMANEGNETQLGVQSSGSKESEELSVFTTLYTHDLRRIAQELKSRTIDPSMAAEQLLTASKRLEERAIGRRPIPNTLPSHKNVYLGVLGLVVLGSAPSGVTMTDATVMNLAPPMEVTDRILISKTRLIAVLDALGLLNDNNPNRIQDIVALLWKEARLEGESEMQKTKLDEVDVESTKHLDDRQNDDFIELGLLKLALFGIAMNQPSWLSKFCIPCGGSGPKYANESWVVKSKMRRTNGELVRHDATKCLMCRDVLFMPCPFIMEETG